MGWIIEEILSDDPGSIEVGWDTYNVGLVEEGRFRSIYSCWCEADAKRLVRALDMDDLWETGVCPGIPVRRPPARKKPATKKKTVARKR